MDENGERPPSLARLAWIMRRLRDPERGCEWDRVQTFETIAPYTIEEAYEVADAVRRGDMEDLKDELGDLQLQVVYHAQMAQERGFFALDDVMAAICGKMERRHPHIFGDAAASPGCEAIKASERATSEDAGALAGVAVALPALKRAEKVQKRAARVGFDWPDPSGPRAKIDEELAELDSAPDAAARAAELGDLLFSIVNYARHLEIDPESALRDAVTRFEQRFRSVERQADRPLGAMALEELEQLWQKAKEDAES